MRLLLASLFVFGVMLLAVGLLSEVVPGDFPPLLLGLGIGVIFLLLCLIAIARFNVPGIGAGNRILQEWEEKGLLISTDYHAVRTFQVEEYEDEGPHYFIELVDGSVLYLNGQYLLDYEPIDDDPELNQPRRFPCTEFTIRRHRDQGFVVDIHCRGQVLEPEVMVPPFRRPDYRLGAVPDDGQVIRDRTYDQIKEERLHGAQGA